MMSLEARTAADNDTRDHPCESGCVAPEMDTRPLWGGHRTTAVNVKNDSDCSLYCADFYLKLRVLMG